VQDHCAYEPGPELGGQVATNQYDVAFMPWLAAKARVLTSRAPISPGCAVVSGHGMPGLYAIAVKGRLPQEVVEKLENNGIPYRPRDGHVA